LSSRGLPRRFALSVTTTPRGASVVRASAPGGRRGAVTEASGASLRHALGDALVGLRAVDAASQRRTAKRSRRLREGDELVKVRGGRTRRVLVTGVTATTCIVRPRSTRGGGGRVLHLGTSGLPDGYERVERNTGGES